MIDTMRSTVAVVLIVGAGLIQGAWTSRWSLSPAQSALRARFESVPMVIGAWKGTTREVPAADRAMAGATACLSAVYTDAARGVSVSVLLLGGLPGKISTHTPDVCYRGAGYTLSPATEFEYRYGSDEHRSVFRTALATRGGTTPSVLRIFWSWNASKGWSAPENPRWSFASEPALCKLYVIRETWGKVVDPEADPCKEFLAAFLPELDRHLFSSPELAFDTIDQP
jgi:uncharacterized protein DUF3485